MIRERGGALIRERGGALIRERGGAFSSPVAEGRRGGCRGPLTAYVRSTPAEQPCTSVAVNDCCAAWRPGGLAALQPCGLAALQPCSLAALHVCLQAHGGRSSAVLSRHCGRLRSTAAGAARSAHCRLRALSAVVDSVYSAAVVYPALMQWFGPLHEPPEPLHECSDAVVRATARTTARTTASLHRGPGLYPG